MLLQSEQMVEHRNTTAFIISLKSWLVSEDCLDVNPPTTGWCTYLLSTSSTEPNSNGKQKKNNIMGSNVALYFPYYKCKYIFNSCDAVNR